MEAVSFPVVEAEIIAFLNAAFAARSEPARAGATKREDQGPYVKVTRIGGSRSLAHDEPMVTFECWDSTSYRAADLARLTRALVGSINTDTVWYGREVGGVASFPDPRTDLPRYQFTALIRTRGEAI